jgi:ribonuclease HII
MLLSHYRPGILEAGCDEAGRGCLAGPVVAAAVIFEEGYGNEYLKDSKKLDQNARKELSQLIKAESLAWSVSMVDPPEIDEINILQASIIAMHRAILKLESQPDHIIVDGNYFKNLNGIPFTCIVKGDDKYLSIAAASILAKHYRDEFMIKLAKEFPPYRWESNKGYPTLAHKRAIWENGLTPHHRRSFNWRPSARQLELSGL